MVKIFNSISVEELSRMLMDAYKSSAAGKQDIETLSRADLANQRTDINSPLDPNKYTNFINNATKNTWALNEVDANILQRMIANASPQIGNSIMGNWTPIDTSNYGDGKNLPTNPLIGTTNPGSVTDNTSIKVPEDQGDLVKQGIVYQRNGQWYKKVAVDVDGNEIPNGKINKNDPSLLYSEKSIPINSPDDVINERKTQYDTISKEYPDLYKDFNHYNESLNSAVKNHAKITPSGTTIEEDQKGKYNSKINSLLPSSPIYFKDNRKTATLQQLADDLNVNPKDIKLDAAQLFWDSPKADLPGGYIEAKLIIDGKDLPKDAPTSVFVPISNEFSEVASVVDHLYKNSFYRGNDHYTADNPYDPNQMFPILQSQPLQIKGQDMVFKTKTLALPKENQQAGKPAFKTLVVPGVKVKNPDGTVSYQYFEDATTTIGQWKEAMKTRLTPLIESVINSGTQSYNTLDFKQQGINDY
jgi:hypothetical protein